MEKREAEEKNYIELKGKKYHAPYSNSKGYFRLHRSSDPEIKGTVCIKKWNCTHPVNKEPMRRNN